MLKFMLNIKIYVLNFCCNFFFIFLFQLQTQTFNAGKKAFMVMQRDVISSIDALIREMAVFSSSSSTVHLEQRFLTNRVSAFILQTLVEKNVLVISMRLTAMITTSPHTHKLLMKRSLSHQLLQRQRQLHERQRPPDNLFFQTKLIPVLQTMTQVQLRTIFVMKKVS